MGKRTERNDIIYSHADSRYYSSNILVALDGIRQGRKSSSDSTQLADREEQDRRHSMHFSHVNQVISNNAALLASLQRLGDVMSYSHR